MEVVFFKRPCKFCQILWCCLLFFTWIVCRVDFCDFRGPWGHSDRCASRIFCTFLPRFCSWEEGLTNGCRRGFPQVALLLCPRCRRVPKVSVALQLTAPQLTEMLTLEVALVEMLYKAVVGWLNELLVGRQTKEMKGWKRFLGNSELNLCQMALLVWETPVSNRDIPPSGLA